MDTTHTSPSPDVLAHNTRCINRRLELGLNALRQHFSVTECAVDPVLANPVIGGRPHHARRFDVAGIGNLLAMTVTEADNAQLVRHHALC